MIDHRPYFHIPAPGEGPPNPILPLLLHKYYFKVNRNYVLAHVCHTIGQLFLEQSTYCYCTTYATSYYHLSLCSRPPFLSSGLEHRLLPQRLLKVTTAKATTAKGFTTFCNGNVTRNCSEEKGVMCKRGEFPNAELYTSLYDHKYN